MRILIIVACLFVLFFSAAGYVRVEYPELFETIIDKGNQFIYNTTFKFDKTDTDTTNAEPKTNTALSPDDLPPATYESYTADKLARAKKAPVVLFFHASWCPSCISTDRIFVKKITTLPPGVSILKIDYDTAVELKERYDITYQHTFVQVDTNGKELARWSGGAIDGIIANLVQ